MGKLLRSGCRKKDGGPVPDQKFNQGEIVASNRGWAECQSEKMSFRGLTGRRNFSLGEGEEATAPDTEDHPLGAKGLQREQSSNAHAARKQKKN